MRVLVCGSRHFKDYRRLEDILDAIGREKKIDTIIHGMARGADQLGAEYARAHKIDLLEFPALWDTYGRRAGPIRNAQMLKEGQPDLVVAFLFPGSRGTKHMIDISKKAGVPVMVINCTEE